MRHVRRDPLPSATQAALDRRQADADLKRTVGRLDINATWDGARKTKPLKTALAQLKAMAGSRERCMYCGDSHGTDIEHFRPKTPYPEHLFRWPNLLLCCTECGRFKGDRFPLASDGRPLLLDPSRDNPWDHLDFDPDTHAFVARFDPLTNAPSVRGLVTVDALQLDRREALEAGYRKTHKRIVAAVEAASAQPTPNASRLCDALSDADDHGLLGWYVSGTGQNILPFTEFRDRHPLVWAECVRTLS